MGWMVLGFSVSGRYCLHLSRMALGPIQPPTQWVPGFSWRKTGQVIVLSTHPHSVPRLKKEYSYTSILGLHGLF
jgi:hypothetical protein